MKKSSKISTTRSTALITISSLQIIFGLTLIFLSIANIETFGWWSLLVGLSGLSAVGTAVMSIVLNDPSWILLDLILPG